MAILTINHYINQANSFITDIRNNRNAYYLFASRSQPWANNSGGDDDSNNSVLAVNNSVAQVEQSVYNDILYGKLLKDADITHLIPRYDWTSNTVYDVYNQNDSNLYTKEFFIVTDKYEVYKCIDNNNRATSYVKPTLTSTSGIFKTGDGYLWKYMYTIDPASNTKFTTTNYIPVSTNSAVQGNATPGSIDLIKITNGGQGYTVYENGYIQGIVGYDKIQLPNTSSSISNYYTNSSIYLKSGFGAGQIREIKSSNGGSKQITVTEPFNTFTRLDLTNISGTIIPGYYAEQPYDIINYLYIQGYYNVGSIVAQSDTGTSGIIISSNSSTIQIIRNNANLEFSNSYPIVDTSQSGVLKIGTVSVGNVGACNIAFVTSDGSGYTANATVTITPNGTGTGASANAQANASGKISTINITAVGNSYFVAPTLTISAPIAQTFNSNTAVTAGTGGGSNNVINLTRLDNISLSGGTALGYDNNDIITVKSATTNAIVTFTTNTTGGSLTFTIANTGAGFALSGTIPVSNIAITNSTGGTATGNTTVTYLVANVASATAFYTANDLITYTVSAGNTAIAGLTSGTTYYVEFANSTVIALKATATGSRIALTKGVGSTGHTLQGQTATAIMYCDNQLVYGSSTRLNNEPFNINANTAGVSNTADTLLISSANSFIFVGDRILYSVPIGNTAIPNLTSNTYYYVTFANSSQIALSTTLGGSNINIAETRTASSPEIHTIISTVAGYANGEYIRIGANTTNNIRRVANNVNTSLLIVTSPFNTSFAASANTHYKMPIAAEPVLPKSSFRAAGYISNTNLSSIEIAISNSALAGLYFIVGEKVNMTDLGRINQGANAIIAFANSSTIILSNISGVWSANSGGTQFFASGESSQQLSQLVSLKSNPNITIRDPIRTFKLNYPVFFRTIDGGSLSGNAIVSAQMTLPNDQTEYQIGPTVRITGDGSNAVGIAIVNTSANSSYNIVGVDIINPGSGYTQANISIYSNTGVGIVGGATASAVISPIYGHGYDAVSELGGRYVGIDAVFDNIQNENYGILGYGSYRKVGILQNPQFKDIKVTLNNFDRANFTINSTGYSPPPTWTPGEVVVQSNTNAAGVVVFGNTTFLQLKNVKGTFNISNTVHGYYSNSTANVITANTIYFPVGNFAEIVTESNTGATGIIISANNANPNVYFMSNVMGQFATGDVMYDSVVNAYATVTSIYTANGTKDSSIGFGDRFNQTARITLTANTGAFIDNEYVQQEISLASGRIISSSYEKDLIITGISTSNGIVIGQTITDTTTNANGICTFANNTYIKLTNISQALSFGTGHVINNGSSVTANISFVLPVLVLNNISDVNNFQAGSNAIIGQTSKASATCNNYLFITNPDLVRDTGKLIYSESFTPVTRSATTKEEFKLVIKF